MKTVGNPVLKELINGGKVIFNSSLQQQVNQLVAQTTSQLLQFNQAATKIAQLKAMKAILGYPVPKVAKRVYEISQKYQATMAQVALAWQWAKGVTSPIVGATKSRYLDDTVGAFNLNLTAEDLNYLEELYVPHKIVGAIDHNPPADVMLLDEDPA